MCDRDCFNCSKPDCDNDVLTRDERISQDVRDRFALYVRKYGAERVRADYERSDRGRERHKKYNATTKGKETMRRYNSSEKGRARQRAYMQSEEGKAKRKAYLESERGKEVIRKIR